MKSSTFSVIIIPFLGLISCMLIGVQSSAHHHVNPLNSTRGGGGKDYNCGGNQGTIVISVAQGGVLNCNDFADLLNGGALGISLSNLFGTCSTLVPVAIGGGQQAQCCSKGSQCNIDENCAANCPGSSQRGGSSGTCASAKCCSYDC